MVAGPAPPPPPTWVLLPVVVGHEWVLVPPNARGGVLVPGLHPRGTKVVLGRDAAKAEGRDDRGHVLRPAAVAVPKGGRCVPLPGGHPEA